MCCRCRMSPRRSPPKAVASWSWVHYTVEGSTFELLAEGFALFDSLAEGVEDTFVVTFEVTDGIDAVANTLTVTVEGANDAPVVEALVRSVGEDGPVFAIDLLSDASDPDEGDVLSVQNVAAAITTEGGRELELGVHYTVVGSTFELTAAGFALFDSLAEGAEDTFVVTFEVTDGIAAVANTLTVTVEGANDAPVVAALVRSVGEDGPVFADRPAERCERPGRGRCAVGAECRRGDHHRRRP
jgi:VCBS repeat-containing protein